jgi:hypothetical protein
MLPCLASSGASSNPRRQLAAPCLRHGILDRPVKRGDDGDEAGGAKTGSGVLTSAAWFPLRNLHKDVQISQPPRRAHSATVRPRLAWRGIPVLRDTAPAGWLKAYPGRTIRMDQMPARQRRYVPRNKRRVAGRALRAVIGSRPLAGDLRIAEPATPSREFLPSTKRLSLRQASQRYWCTS